jgi:hypothetical protein
MTGLKPGDLISIRSGTTSTVTIATLSIFRLSGPSVIAATESVNCKYTSGGAQQNIPNNSSTTITVNTVKSYDSHNAFNTSTGTFTAPISGVYSANVGYQHGSNASGIRVLYIYSSNGEVQLVSYLLGSGSIPAQLSGTASFRLLAGQTIYFQTYQNCGSALATTTDPSGTWIAIERVGN